MNEYDKYTRITYESMPIGKQRIVLQLTTFDLEKFNKEKGLRKIPTKQVAISYDFDRFDNTPDLMNRMQAQYETFIRNVYDEQIKELKGYIEYLRSQNDRIPLPTWHIEE